MTDKIAGIFCCDSSQWFPETFFKFRNFGINIVNLAVKISFLVNNDLIYVHKRLKLFSFFVKRFKVVFSYKKSYCLILFVYLFGNKCRLHNSRRSRVLRTFKQFDFLFQLFYLLIHKNVILALIGISNNRTVCNLASVAAGITDNSVCSAAYNSFVSDVNALKRDLFRRGIDNCRFRNIIVLELHTYLAENRYHNKQR